MSGDAVRVEVLEALASAWEDQAKGLSRVKAVSIENCARMLRDVIADMPPGEHVGWHCEHLDMSLLPGVDPASRIINAQCGCEMRPVYSKREDARAS
jgi:hypothetical protein